MIESIAVGTKIVDPVEHTVEQRLG